MITATQVRHKLLAFLVDVHGARLALHALMHETVQERSTVIAERGTGVGVD